MANMSLKKNPMPSQDPNVRNKNFDEVALGDTEAQALDEAQRCLHCKNPRCISSIEEECDQIFELSSNGKYRCIYCEQELQVKPE